MSRPPGSTRGHHPRRPTHSLHTPSSSLSHIVLGGGLAPPDAGAAPGKGDSAVGFASDDEASPTHLATTSGKKSTGYVSPVSTPKRNRSERQSVSEGASGEEKSLPIGFAPRRHTMLASTPLRASLLDPLSDDVNSPASVVALEQDFEKTMNLSNSKARCYIAPHRRSFPPTPSSLPGAAIRPLSSYDRSAVPEPEDHFYTSPSRSRGQLSASRVERTPPSSPLSPVNSLRSLSRGSKYTHDHPSYSPPAALISRGPYDDPLRFSHPSAIPEEAESLCSWADEVNESFENDSEMDYEDRAALFVSVSAESEELDLPSVGSSNSGKALRSPINSNSEENVCTGCGAPPVQSFVALLPCDHLLCHACLNSLVNSVAHKPPRPTDCFACGVGIESFIPAWEGVGAASGGTIGLVEALKDTLRSEINLKTSEVIKDDFMQHQHAASKQEERSTKGRRRRSSVAAAAIAATLLMSSSPSNKDLASLSSSTVVPRSPVKTRSRSRSPSLINQRTHLSPTAQRRSNAASDNDFNVISTPESSSATPIRPMRPRSISAQSALAHFDPLATSGSPSYAAVATRSRSNSMATSKGSPVAIRRSRSDSFTFIHLHSHSRDGTDETTTATPDLSFAMSPVNQHHEDDGMRMPRTPPGRGTRGVAVAGSSSMDHPGAHEIFKSPIAVQQLQELRDPIEWPIVRLDNIPWDITAGEIEEWLPANSLAPADECVLAVHILCNRGDGRTLNQCYVEAASVAAARNIVRTRDGKKLGYRPVHATISGQGELLTTLFPTYDPGFSGMEVLKNASPCPLLMQTELTGLLTLCKLETTHACKVKERPYFNIVSIVQKFPWSQPETYNSQQVVRLYNTVCAAVEILSLVRDDVPEWNDILLTVADAVMLCPAFRPNQRAKFIKMCKKAGLDHLMYPDTHFLPHLPKKPKILPFRFSPEALRENYVTVGVGAHLVPSHGIPFDIDIARAASPVISPTSSPPRRVVLGDRTNMGRPKLSKATSTPNLYASPSFAKPLPLPSPFLLPSPFPANDTNDDGGHEKLNKPKTRKRRTSSIARTLGVEDALVKAVAEQLGLASTSSLPRA